MFISWFFLFADCLFFKFPVRFIHSSWVWMAPVVFVAFMGRPLLEGVLVLVLSLVVIHLADRTWDLQATSRTLKSLTNTNKGFEKPALRGFEDYLGPGLGTDLDLGKALHTVDAREFLHHKETATKGDKIPLGDYYLFQIIPNDRQAFIGSFALNVAPNLSFVFTPYDPDKLNPSRVLALLHECGHCSSQSWDRRRTYFGAVGAAAAISVLSSTSLPLACAMTLYYAICFFRNRSRASANRFWEELSADALCSALFSRAIAEPKLLPFTTKLLQPKRKLIAPEDAKLTALENKARIAMFRYGMRPSPEHEQKAEDLLDKAVTRHVNISVLIAIVAALIGAVTFTALSGAFWGTKALMVGLSISALFLLISVVVSMLSLTKSIESIFDFHLSLDASRKSLRDSQLEGLAQRGIEHFQNHFPMARALGVLHRFGHTGDNLDKKFKDMPEPVVELIFAITEFVFQSLGYVVHQNSSFDKPEKLEKKMSSRKSY